jgi:hypothetical protein
MNGRMKMDYTKHLWSPCKTIITLVIGAAIMFFFQEPLKRYLYDSKELRYEVLSSQELNKPELLQLVLTNFRQAKLDFSMDDNFIPSYHYTVLELRNVGNFIKDDLLFDIDFKNVNIKILGVLCKMIEPEEREMEAEITRPPLKYEIQGDDKDTADVKIRWSITDPQGGAIIYRSYIKDGGFGRRNPTLILNDFFFEKAKKGNSYYYSVTNQGYSGQESELAEIIFVPVPEFMFNRSSFKETKIIDAAYPDGEIEAKALLFKFNKVKTKLKSNGKIFVDMDRKDFSRISFEKIDKLPVYFKDDVKFLHGKTTIQLSNIMKKARIRLYIISKTYLKHNNYNLILSLRDPKDIELKRIESKSKKINGEDKPPLGKELLTPHDVKVFIGKGEIVLRWVIPKSKNYRGVRIFKSLYSRPSGDLFWGDELYEGEGVRGIIMTPELLKLRELHKKVRINEKKSSFPFARFEPPPRKSQSKEDLPPLPGPPTGLRVTGFGIILNGYGGELMPFYEDKKVTLGNSYVYTLVAYDDKGNYSYPIESIIKYESEEDQPQVRVFPEYQNNLEVLQILRKYYADNANYAKKEELEPIISEIEKKEKIVPKDTKSKSK